MMMTPILEWVMFGAIVVIMLAFDLWVFHRKAHVITMKEALAFSAMWIALALLFNFGLYLSDGYDVALKFFTGYLIEKSLSVDNLFVFYMIFAYFKTPPEHQYKVLFWGILGALVMRAIFISAGVTLIATLHWTIYVFGAFLIVTGIKLAFQKEQQLQPERNLALRIFRKAFRVTPEYHGDKFLIREAGALIATPLLVTLIVIETTDLVFATDSIPAILGITTDPFIVYSSNIFAILGLRALYFVLAGLMDLFRYLHYGLAVVLVFIGGKMVAENWIEIPIGISLGIVAGVLIVSIVISLLRRESKEA